TPQSTATYFIAVGGNTDTNPFPYSFRVSSAGNSGTPYTLGAVVADGLVNPGQQQRYTFNGTAGQRLYYDAQQEDNEAIYASIFDQAGSSLLGRFNSDYNEGTFTLPYTGPYTVLLDADGATTGGYQWRLLDVASAPAITYGAGVTNR